MNVGGFRTAQVVAALSTWGLLHACAGCGDPVPDRADSGGVDAPTSRADVGDVVRPDVSDVIMRGTPECPAVVFVDTDHDGYVSCRELTDWVRHPGMPSLDPRGACLPCDEAGVICDSIFLFECSSDAGFAIWLTAHCESRGARWRVDLGMCP